MKTKCKCAESSESFIPERCQKDHCVQCEDAEVSSGCYVIVGSAAFVPEEPHVPLYNNKT